MKKRFSVIALLISAAGAALGFFSGGLVAALLGNVCNYSVENVVKIITSGYCAAAAVFFGYLGLRLGLWLDAGKYRIVNPRPMVTVAALLLAFAAGALGQTLYCLENQSYLSTVQVSGEMSGAHIVLLMDESSSMNSYVDTCKEAACAFVDELNEDFSLQFMAFSYDVKDRNTSQFLPMTDKNKEVVKDVIRNAYDMGGTDFDLVLAKALDTLSDHADPDYKSVVILLTDGADYIDDSATRQTLSSDDVAFFTVRITMDDQLAQQDPAVQALIDLADEDFVLTTGVYGDLKTGDVIKALQDAMSIAGTKQITKWKLVLTTKSVWTGEETGIHQWIARLAMCAALSLIAALAYCGSLNLVQALINLTVGAGCGVVLQLLPPVGIAVFLVLCMGAFVRLEEVTGDV